MLRWKRGANVGVSCQRMKISGRLGVEGHIGEKPYKPKNLKPQIDLEKQADGRILRKAKERGERIWTGKRGSSKHGAAMDAVVKQTYGVNDNSQLQTPTPNAQLPRPGAPNESRMQGLGRSKQRKRSFSIAG